MGKRSPKQTLQRIVLPPLQPQLQQLVSHVRLVDSIGFCEALAALVFLAPTWKETIGAAYFCFGDFGPTWKEVTEADIAAHSVYHHYNHNYNN